VEAATQQALDHRLPTTVVVFVVAHGLLARRAETPDVAVLAILAPGGFVAVQDRASTRLLLEASDQSLQRAPHLVQQGDDFACTKAQLMDRVQIDLDAADGQAQAGAQVADQRGDPNPDPSLAQHLASQLQLGAVPALAVRTEAFDDPVFNHLDRPRR
jgi:hypothetical protein